MSTPLIAAAYDPPLALVRSLVRAGAHDVVPLPLNIETLRPRLRRLPRASKRAEAIEDAQLQARQRHQERWAGSARRRSAAARDPVRPKAKRRPVAKRCLIDLDVQFGDVAFQLGLAPKLSLADLLEAGSTA